MVTELLSPEVWRAVEDRGHPVEFKCGEALMHQGSTGRSCYAIVSGTTLVTATSTQGATLVLGRRFRGSLVGELAALEGAPRSATVTAKDDVTSIKLNWEDLHEIIRQHPDWSIQLLQHFAGRIRILSERFAMRSEDLQHRLLEVLVANYEESGDPVFRSTREELAGWVGATREAVVRSLQRMKSDGIVDLGRGTVRLLACAD